MLLRIRINSYIPSFLWWYSLFIPSRFTCGVCYKAFNQKNALKKHNLKHSGERPFVCPFCAYAFNQKGNLKTHIQRTHSEQAQQLVEKEILRTHWKSCLLAENNYQIQEQYYMPIFSSERFPSQHSYQYRICGAK